MNHFSVRPRRKEAGKIWSQRGVLKGTHRERGSGGQQLHEGVGTQQKQLREAMHRVRMPSPAVAIPAEMTHVLYSTQGIGGS